MGDKATDAPTKAMILDALIREKNDDETIGKPENPVKPLFGSENVPITPEEEKIIEQ